MARKYEPSKKLNWQHILNKDLKSIEEFCQNNPTVDFNAPLLNGWTALMYACKEKSVGITQYLLENGADPNCQKDMFTPLMCLTSQLGVSFTEDGVRCVELLCKYGANINEKDRFHTTALMYAAKTGNVPIIKKLVECGAAVDQQDTRGETALTMAAFKGNYGVVEALCQLGAAIGIRTNDGDTAFTIAEDNNYAKISGIISQYENNISENGGVEDINGTNGSHHSNGEDNNDDETERQQSSIDGSTDMKGQVKSNIRSEGDRGDGSSKNFSFGCPSGYRESTDYYENVMFGPMQMFLTGLGVTGYIEQFEKHCITFPLLLRMQDDDLAKIGINEYGIRMKILEGIREWHLAEMKPESLLEISTSVDNVQAISVVSNISKHTALLSSSLAYLSAHLHTVPHVLEGCPDDANVEVLLNKCQVMTRNVQELYVEVTKLDDFLENMSSQPHYRPADLITIKKHSSVSWSRVKTVSVLIGVGVATFLTAKYSRNFKTYFTIITHKTLNSIL